MVEVVGEGLDHMRMFRENIRLSHDQSSGAKPYGRPEFDKWFAGYDAICEIPSYSGGTPVVDAYIGDPDVKFILSERTPASFSRSINKTVGEFVMAGRSFPLNLLNNFNSFNKEFFNLGEDLYLEYSQGRLPTDPDCAEMIERWYEEYITTIKKYVPPERLLHVRLEDGLGWEEICPFLGLDIPETPYPRGNDPDEFKKIAQKVLDPGVKKSFGIVAVSALAVAGAGAWWIFQ
ncbi:hypothetical protein Daus18300_003846 [Diaporthe australafricana]|uniref:Uncharacterized protein n=1 Tax=Diaporthe australafricana TaxID=127596 RepID=A0ABR3XC05_9PEZI